MPIPRLSDVYFLHHTLIWWGEEHEAGEDVPCLKTCSKALTQEQGQHRGITAACVPPHAQLRGKGIFSVTPYSLAKGGLTSLERENILGFPYTGCSAMPFREIRKSVTDIGDGKSDLL